MNLVIQSFGSQSEYKRAILTIWSFFVFVKKPPASTQVIFLTDDPAYFNKYLAGLPIQFVLLTPEKFKVMRGEIDFLHRMKIALVEEAFQISKGNLLYADSDTFFLADPSPLMNEVSESKAYMHLLEYRFDSLRNMKLPAAKSFHAFLDLISSNSFKDADGSKLEVSVMHNSWNAGVMMLHASHARLLPDVYALTSQFYITTNNHASEQYAFSVVLQTNTRLQSCESVIYHYWYRVKKQIMDNFLSARMNSRWAQLPKDEKIYIVRKWINALPGHLENHVWMLRDQSIQAFHENKFDEGYRFAARAILKNPWGLSFIKDLAYHTKRWVRRNSKNAHYEG